MTDVHQAALTDLLLCVHLDREPRTQEEEQEAAHVLPETVQPRPQENGKLLHLSFYLLIDLPTVLIMF